MKYYLLLKSESKGPFVLTTVRDMLAVGAIQDTTLIAPEGGNGWSPVGKFLEGLPTGASAIGGTMAESGTMYATTSQKRYGNRKIQVAAALLFGIGLLAYQKGDHSESTNNASYEVRRGFAQGLVARIAASAYHVTSVRGRCCQVFRQSYRDLSVLRVLPYRTG